MGCINFSQWIPFKVPLYNNAEYSKSIIFSYISLFLSIIGICIFSTIVIINSYSLTKTETENNFSYGETYTIKYTCLKSIKCYIFSSYEYEDCKKYSINGNITIDSGDSKDLTFCSSPLQKDGLKLYIHTPQAEYIVNKNAIYSRIEYDENKIIDIQMFEFYKERPIYFKKFKTYDKIFNREELSTQVNFGFETLSYVEDCIAPVEPLDNKCFVFRLLIDPQILNIYKKYLYTNTDILSNILSSFIIFGIIENIVIQIKKKYLINVEKMCEDRDLELGKMETK